MALADFLYPRSKHSSAELCLIVSACQLSSQLSFITFAKFFLPRYLRIEERPLTWQTKTCSTTNLTRHDFHIMVSTSFVCHLFPRFSLPYQPLSTSCTQLLGLDGHAVCAQHFSLLSEFLFANKAQLHATLFSSRHSPCVPKRLLRMVWDRDFVAAYCLGAKASRSYYVSHHHLNA